MAQYRLDPELRGRMVFFVAAIGVAVVVLAPQAKFLLRRRRTLSRDWDELIASVEKVNLEAVRDVADMFLSPTKDQLRLEPAVVWQMLGGLKGLDRLRQNATTMLELCVYAEQWDSQGRVISEMIRLDAVNLNRAIRRVQLSSVFGLGRVRGHLALVETAAHYELIRRRLFSFYEQSHAGRLPVLQQQLG